MGIYSSENTSTASWFSLSSPLFCLRRALGKTFTIKRRLFEGSPRIFLFLRPHSPRTAAILTSINSIANPLPTAIATQQRTKPRKHTSCTEIISYLAMRRSKNRCQPNVIVIQENMVHCHSTVYHQVKWSCYCREYH